MSCDDFGALFSNLFGNLYSDSAPPPKNIIIGGVYGRHEGVSFRRMHYRGDFTVAFPAPLDEITFVIPTAGKIIFNHVTESVGFARIGLAIDKAEVLSARFVDNHAQHGISISRALITERLSMLLGKPILQKICFEPVVDLSVPALQGIKALVDMATGTEFDLLINTGSLMPSRLREMLVDAVLEAWPHNFTEAQPVRGWSFTRTAPVPLQTLLDGKYSVVVRTASTDGNVDIFCGDIKATEPVK